MTTLDDFRQPATPRRRRGHRVRFRHGQDQVWREFESAKDAVVWLWQRNPEAASDYRKLVHLYHYHIDGLRQFIPFQRLEQATSPETIDRAFRKAVEEHLITIPDGSLRRRRRRADAVSQWAVGEPTNRSYAEWDEQERKDDEKNDGASETSQAPPS